MARETSRCEAANAFMNGGPRLKSHLSDAVANTRHRVPASRRLRPDKGRSRIQALG